MVVTCSESPHGLRAAQAPVGYDLTEYLAGSLLALQTALGFTLTFFTVQAVPLVADALGWRATLALLALGPAVGIAAMRRLMRLIGERAAAGPDTR